GAEELDDQPRDPANDPVGREPPHPEDDAEDERERNGDDRREERVVQPGEEVVLPGGPFDHRCPEFRVELPGPLQHPHDIGPDSQHDERADDVEQAVAAPGLGAGEVEENVLRAHRVTANRWESTVVRIPTGMTMTTNPAAIVRKMGN